MAHSYLETFSSVKEGWPPQMLCLHSQLFLVTTVHHQVEQLGGTPKEYLQNYNQPDVFKISIYHTSE